MRALNTVIAHGINAPAVVKSLAAEGSEVVTPVTPEEFKTKFDTEYAALEKLMKVINIKLQ